MEAPTIPTLKDQALAMLQSLINAATQAGDFIKDQIPLVIQELLKFNLAYNLVWLVVGIVCVISAFLFGKKLWPWAKKYANASDEMSYAAVIVPVIGLCVAGAVVFLVHIRPFMLLWLAPRVWLIEYAAALVK